MVRFATVAAVLALMAAPLVAQESTEQLRKELESLRKEVDGLKADRVQYESKEVAGAAKVDANSMAPEGDSPIMTALKGTKLSGFVDAGYQFSFNSLHSDPGANPGPVGRAFDNRGNSFYLNAVQLNLERLATKDMIVGYHLELAAGHDVTVYESAQVGLQEGWVEILAPVGTGLDIKIGKMATLVGYEVVESKDDFNYSRGLLFTNIQPITHTGVRGTYNINDQISATAGFSNGLNTIGTDTFSDPDHGKQFELNLTVKPSKDLMVAATVLVGNDTTTFAGAGSGDKYYLFDIVAAYTMDKLTLALNLDFASAQLAGNARAPFSGIAVYGKFAWTDAMASAIRIEYLSDHDGALAFSGPATGDDTGTGSRFFEVTLTQEMKVAQQLILRVELRSDNSNNHNFARDGKAARGDTTLGFEAIMPF